VMVFDVDADGRIAGLDAFIDPALVPAFS